MQLFDAVLHNDPMAACLHELELCPTVQAMTSVLACFPPIRIRVICS